MPMGGTERWKGQISKCLQRSGGMELIDLKKLISRKKENL